MVARAVRRQLDPLDGEPEPAPELGQRRDVARGAVTEGEVAPDQDGRGVQALDQNLVGELGRRAPRRARW